MVSRPPLLVLVGPTGVGKTAVAVGPTMAMRGGLFNAEVYSHDGDGG